MGGESVTERGRLVSLDVFRGITIAAMVLVNNPGDWGHIYWPLAHAPWHGWTPTDLIFPFFLFIMGVSMTFSGRARSSSPARTRKALTRGILLFLIGMFMRVFPAFSFSGIRIPGVLQRISLVYLLAFPLAGRRVRTILAWFSLLLLGYWALMELVPVPGFGSGNLSPEGNLAAYLDRLLLGGHLYQGSWDPEGLLSTLPALATALSGLLAGRILRSSREDTKKVCELLLWGGGSLGVGLLWDFWFPINKNLWTSSYVLFTSGAAFLSLAACYYWIDVRQTAPAQVSLPVETGPGMANPSRDLPRQPRQGRVTFFFQVFGMNALALFVFSGLFAKLTFLPLWEGGPGLQKLLYDAFFVPWLNPYNASLAFGLAYIGFWWLLMYGLYRRRIFWKL